MRSLPPWSLLPAILLATSSAGANPLLLKAHDALLGLDLLEARSLLDQLPKDDPDVVAERTLLAIYEGDCDSAVRLLERHGLADRPTLSGLTEIARGCARVTASTIIVNDDRRGFKIRFKNEKDVPLAPFLMDVTDQAIETLRRDLQVRLPRPIRIDVVSDHFSLAAMTGLPEEAAQTTGTVAIAKWGRVTMLSPRAMPHGYGWADTLMHELTHLSVSRASHDRAPLWLQEGVAKREETRWRAPLPFDGLPSPDTVARLGFERGLALPLDKLGPSVAMLPTAEQAMVVFAEVNSFVRYWLSENGDNALGPFLHALATAPAEGGVDTVLKQLTNQNLATWSQRWQETLSSAPSNLPPDLLPVFPPRPGDPPPSASSPSPRILYKTARLAELLEGRGHPLQAVHYAKQSQEAAPYDAAARTRLARPLRALGRTEEADALVARLDAVHSAHGLFLAFHGDWQRRHNDESAAKHAFSLALGYDPFSSEVACELADTKQLPPEKAQADLCQMVRQH